MDVLTSEICWALNNETIKQVTSSWALFIQLLRFSSKSRSLQNKTYPCVKFSVHEVIIMVPVTTTLYGALAKSLLHAFGKLRKATISIVMSVCPSVGLSARNNFVPNWQIFMKFVIRVFWKYVKKIHVSLTSDKHHRYFIWNAIYTFDYISLNSS